MADYTEFTSLVSSFVPNVPPFVVAKAAQQCCQDFFGRTTELQSEINLTTVAGQRKYTLTPTVSDTFVNLVLCVLDENDRSVAYSQQSNSIVVDPIPQSEMTYKVTVSLTPTIEATEIPDNVYFRHANSLRNGVIAILKNQNGTEWYSPVEAANYQQMFERDITQSRILQLTTSQGLTMQAPSFDGISNNHF